MPTLPMLHTYKAGPIEQVVLPGETVGIWVNKVYEFYRALYVEGIMRSDPVTIDLGATTVAAPITALTQATLLQMPDQEFAQFRMEVLDDVQVAVYQGRADQRHKLFTVNAALNRSLPLHDPDAHTTEMYEYEDNYLFLQATNLTAYPITQARVSFWGYRYVLEALTEYSWSKKQLPQVWTRIPATAHL